MTLRCSRCAFEPTDPTAAVGARCTECEVGRYTDISQAEFDFQADFPDDFPDDFDPHATARDSDPDTSHEAAEAVNATISDACKRVRETMYACGPASHEDLQNFYAVLRVERQWPDMRCVRKRVCDLVKAGYAYDTGRRVLNPVGRRVAVWALRDLHSNGNGRHA